MIWISYLCHEVAIAYEMVHAVTTELLFTFYHGHCKQNLQFQTIADDKNCGHS